MPQADTQPTERGGRAVPGTARAIIERAAGCNYRFACFELQPYERRLLAAGEPAAVSPHAFDLLIALVAHAGRLVTKEELLERVWPNLVVEENNLDKQVSNLRRILGADAIETVRGQGYRFTLPAMRVEVAPPALAAKSRRTNLPASLTSFVGRQRELVEIKRLLPDSRLLTLVGIGGIGKTRLALQAAAEVLDAYRDGVWFVDLAPVNDPALVTSALAQVLGVSEAAGKPLVETLCAQIKGRELLLVLDNCEHLLEACALLAAAVLRSAAEAAIIATSREPLHIAGEQTYPLPALSLPDPSANAEEVGRSEAVQLFVERARRHQPDFALTAARARAVAELCIHLDGIPLALELAATRVRSLAIEQINARLDDRFKLLTDRNRTALPRQQTLRGTLDWSHGLLSEHERVLLRRLAIFVGGFTLEAAAAVASDDMSTVIELLSYLVERSLVVADTNAARARYRLLETTRAYALGKLAEAGELDAIKRRHAQHFRDRFEPAYDDWLRLSDAAWHELYVPERDNVRAALDWALGTSGDPAIGVAIAGASGPLWLEMSLPSEGLQRLETAVARVGSCTSKLEQARLWVWMAMLRIMGAPALAAAHLERAIELYRGLEETPALGFALVRLGTLQRHFGRFEQSALTLARAFRVLERSGRPKALAFYFSALGLQAAMTGDLSAARMHFEKALRLHRDAGCESVALTVLDHLVQVSWALGDLDAALAASLETVAQQRNSPFARKNHFAAALVTLAGIRTERGELDEALTAAREGLPLLQEMGWPWRVLDYLALRAALAGKLADAARIAGYADARFTAEKWTRGPNVARARERLRALLREKLDAEKVERLFAEGAKLSEDEACRLSLEE